MDASITINPLRSRFCPPLKIFTPPHTLGWGDTCARFAHARDFSRRSQRGSTDTPTKRLCVPSPRPSLFQQIDRDLATRLDHEEYIYRHGLNDVSVLSLLPPLLHTIDDAGHMQSKQLPLATTERRARWHVPLHRAVLATDASITITPLLGGDAAFLMQYAGVSLQSKCNQLFNLETRDDRTLVWQIDVLPADESPRRYVMRVKPDSFDSSGESRFLELFLLGMREDSNLIGYEHTKIPDEEDEVTVAGEAVGKARPKPKGRGAAKAAATATDKRGAGKHTTVQQKRWARADLRAIGYSHKEFSPATHSFDGA